MRSAQKSHDELAAPFAAARSSKKCRALAPSPSEERSSSKDNTSMTMLTPSTRLTNASWWSGTCRRSLGVKHHGGGGAQTAGVACRKRRVDEFTVTICANVASLLLLLMLVVYFRLRCPRVCCVYTPPPPPLREHQSSFVISGLVLLLYGSKTCTHRPGTRTNSSVFGSLLCMFTKRA